MRTMMISTNWRMRTKMRLVGAASKDLNLWHEIVVITISACSDDRDVDEWILLMRRLSSKDLCSKGRNCGHHGTSKSIKHSNWFAHLRHRVHPVVFLLGSAIRVRQNIFGQGYSTCKDLLFITAMGAMTKLNVVPPTRFKMALVHKYDSLC